MLSIFFLSGFFWAFFCLFVKSHSLWWWQHQRNIIWIQNWYQSQQKKHFLFQIAELYSIRCDRLSTYPPDCHCCHNNIQYSQCSKKLEKSAKSHKKIFFCNVLVRRVRLLKNKVKSKRFFFDNPKFLSREWRNSYIWGNSKWFILYDLSFSTLLLYTEFLHWHDKRTGFSTKCLSTTYLSLMPIVLPDFRAGSCTIVKFFGRPKVIWNYINTYWKWIWIICSSNRLLVSQNT